MQTNQAKLQGLTDQFSKTYAKFQKLRTSGNGMSESNSDAQDIYQEIDYMFSSVINRMRYLEDDLYNFMEKHSKNHVPALNSASSLEKFLESVGMANDYEVTKPKLTVKASTLEVG